MNCNVTLSAQTLIKMITMLISFSSAITALTLALYFPVWTSRELSNRSKATQMYSSATLLRFRVLWADDQVLPAAKSLAPQLLQPDTQYFWGQTLSPYGGSAACQSRSSTQATIRSQSAGSLYRLILFLLMTLRCCGESDWSSKAGFLLLLSPSAGSKFSRSCFLLSLLVGHALCRIVTPAGPSAAPETTLAS